MGGIVKGIIWRNMETSRLRDHDAAPADATLLNRPRAVNDEKRKGWANPQIGLLPLPEGTYQRGRSTVIAVIFWAGANPALPGYPILAMC